MNTYTIEIINNLISWYKDWFSEKLENNKIIQCVDINCKLYNKKNKNIYPGDIIYLKKDAELNIAACIPSWLFCYLLFSLCLFGIGLTQRSQSPFLELVRG